MSTTHVQEAPSPVRMLVPLIAALLLAAAVTAASAAAVQAQDDALTLEKYVAALNDMAPEAPDAVTVVPGDSVAFGITASAPATLAGTEVVITDVFAANELQFQNAGAAGCVEAEGAISCTVTLDDAGQTEVTLTFTVLPDEAAGDGCRELVNEASVQGEGVAEATASASIQTCPEGAEGTASGAGGEAAGGDGSGSGAGQPDTALPASASGASGLLTQLGAMMLGAAIVWGLGAAGNRLAVPVEIARRGRPR